MEIKILDAFDEKHEFKVGDYFLGSHWGNDKPMLRKIVDFRGGYAIYTPQKDWIRGASPTIPEAVNFYSNVEPVEVISETIEVRKLGK